MSNTQQTAETIRSVAGLFTSVGELAGAIKQMKLEHRRYKDALKLIQKEPENASLIARIALGDED